MLIQIVAGWQCPLNATNYCLGTDWHERIASSAPVCLSHEFVPVILSTNQECYFKPTLLLFTLCSPVVISQFFVHDMYV